MIDNLVHGITLNILVIDLTMISKKAKNLPEIGKVFVPNVSMALKYIVPLMNILSAILNFNYRNILNNTLLKLSDKALDKIDKPEPCFYKPLPLKPLFGQ